MADPSESTVADLTDIDHIEFVKTFQPPFDVFYATPAARKRGAQKQWVIKNVLVEFIPTFGVPSPVLINVCILF